MSTVPVLYVAAFQFSGSTLLSFLLNDHDDITTVGHMMGWPSAGEDFRCSCGARLTECPFYDAIKRAFEAEKLPFDLRDFGTAYSLARNQRVNRILTSGLPLVERSSVELTRDWLVRTIPALRRKVAQIDRANRTFIHTALRLNNASVFVDNSHSPYRFRHLTRIDGLALHYVHLVRDPRGTVLSAMTNLKWDLETATRLWCRQYTRAARIASEAERSLRMFYEDLCSWPDKALAEVHRFVRIEPRPFSGDFKRKPHHILGNEMRLRSGKVTLDERWRRDLTDRDQRYVALAVARAARRHPSLSAVVDRYFS
jgi:hypothetical protein